MGCLMDQVIINWIIAAFGALVGFVLKVVWDELKALQKEDREIADKVSSIEVLVAGNYVKRDEFERMVTRMFEKLDTIEEKISGKVDR